MVCSRPWIMKMRQHFTLMIVIQLWQTSPGADPPPLIQEKVEVCFPCNERRATFTWTHPIKSIYRIHWKFKDIFMANYTKTALDFTQESLNISQNYKGRFHLLTPGGVGFSLNNVTRADIGTYRCIITSLTTGVGETLEGDLVERDIDRKDKVEVCGNAVFNWTWRNEQPFSLIQWQFDHTTFANTTKAIFSLDSLDISADYKARFSLLHPGDVGFQLDHVSREDTGTYTCIITSQSSRFTIVGDVEVTDQQNGDFNITLSNKEMLTCGERRESTYSWIFSNTTGRENETSTGHELRLSSIPQKGSLYCLRHSDCTRSLPYSFSSGEVPEEGGSNTAAVVVPIVVISIIIIIIVIVIILRKRRRERERISGETGGGETVSGVEEQML